MVFEKGLENRRKGNLFNGHCMTGYISSSYWRSSAPEQRWIHFSITDLWIARFERILLVRITLVWGNSPDQAPIGSATVKPTSHQLVGCFPLCVSYFVWNVARSHSPRTFDTHRFGTSVNPTRISEQWQWLSLWICVITFKVRLCLGAD